jgi:transcriptional regulator with XRE-family HTH domain
MFYFNFSNYQEVSAVKETFGERVRRKRQIKQITLRKFASLVNVSPTYISQIEKNKFSPPSEEVICKISYILEENKDELLSLTNKIHSDILAIINCFPKEITTFLRAARGFDRDRWQALIKQIDQEKI